VTIGIFQFHGCDKCFAETTLLKEDPEADVLWVPDPASYDGTPTDAAVVCGYLLPSDKAVLDQISTNAGKIIAYGSCPASGGIFGLANQKGRDVVPIQTLVPEAINVDGCLAEVEELQAVIAGEIPNHAKQLCPTCARRSTCKFLDKVVRQLDLADADKEACFNDLGFMCMGYVANECKERCISAGTPCRGCKPKVDRPGIRMLGMFGTLMGNIEVATEGSKYGATDKLADKNDDVTNALPDIVGNFFRFSLPVANLPKGRQPSNGSVMGDVLAGRLVEELPLILGMAGGQRFISLTLQVIEAYEQGAGITPSEQVQAMRQQLVQLEGELTQAVSARDPAQYRAASTEIRKLAGNMNLSNIFYGGFKVPFDGAGEASDFDNYRAKPFEVKDGAYTSGPIQFTLDPTGIVTQFTAEEVAE